MSDLVYIDLFEARRSPLERLSGRPQKWRWRAVNGRNHRTLAVSSEAYTNKADVLAAITQLFGVSTWIYLRDAGSGNTLLRPAAGD